MRGFFFKCVLLAGLSGCAARVTLPDFRPPDGEISEALLRFAPVLVQETAPGSPWDRPTAIDAAGSAAPPWYVSGRADRERLYLFYGLYYPLDWSGSAASPRTDHRADFEGALVVVSRRTRRVEAAVTQAHKRFYLWCAPEAGHGRSCRGPLPLASEGRPLLFAESGGHGLYAFGEAPLRPKGGRRYPRGPAGVAAERLVRFSEMEQRPLQELLRHTTPDHDRFRGVPAKARPPWAWRAPGSARGAIVADPAAFYAAIAAAR